VKVDPSGKRDLTVQSKYFATRLPGYQHMGAAVVNNALLFLKYDLRQPFLDPLSDRDQRLQNPAWMDEGGRLAEGGGPNVLVVQRIAGFGRDEFGTRPLEDTHDEEFEEALATAREPLLHEEILSDAQAAAFDGNLRRAVLELALACEVVVKQAFFGSSRAEQVFEHLEDRRQVNVRVIDLLDGVAASVLGQSLKIADPPAYTDLDHLFRARNKGAHRGEPIYKDDSGIRHEVTVDVLRQWWNSVGRLLSWLGNQAGS
jgi:hypothetical protein